MFELAREEEQAKAMLPRDEVGNGTWPRIARPGSRRDPEKVYHKMSKPELASLSPVFRWNLLFTGSGAPEFQSINVRGRISSGRRAEIQSASLPEWKTYLTCTCLHSERR